MSINLELLRKKIKEEIALQKTEQYDTGDATDNIQNIVNRIVASINHIYDNPQKDLEVSGAYDGQVPYHSIIYADQYEWKIKRTLNGQVEDSPIATQNWVTQNRERFVDITQEFYQHIWSADDAGLIAKVTTAKGTFSGVISFNGDDINSQATAYLEMLSGYGSAGEVDKLLWNSNKTNNKKVDSLLQRNAGLTLTPDFADITKFEVKESLPTNVVEISDIIQNVHNDNKVDEDWIKKYVKEEIDKDNVLDEKADYYDTASLDRLDKLIDGGL